MTSLVLSEKKRALSKDQQNFNRLKKTIFQLQKKLRRLETEFNECLDYYLREVEPLKKEFVCTLLQFIKTTYSFRNLAPKNKYKIFKQLILDRIDELFSFISFGEVDTEIQDIFSQLDGRSFQQYASKQVGGYIQDMEGMFEEAGINIDLSQINPHDDEQEMQRKLFEALKDAPKTEQHSSKPQKSKKELKTEQFEQLKNKSLNSLYKELVKEAHPDLEHCSSKKLEKVELMKTITTAYEKRDLYTLIQLKMGYLDTSGKSNEFQDDRQLKHYNSLLQEQINYLKMDMEMLSIHPKYIPIQDLIENDLDNRRNLDEYRVELSEKIQFLGEYLTDFKEKPPKKVLINLLQEYSEAMKMGDFMDMIDQIIEEALF